ncbi:MAG: RHS repeat-associated core domain-containing protein [Nitrospiraceae bacterium]|nr:MAG: RHS repeat-associated core domain-containing protein [Nitrospiraceae bacterium]
MATILQKIALLIAGKQPGSPLKKYYYHTDHLESSTIITDQNGTNVEDMFYYPYGEMKYHAGSVNVKHKFNGHEYDGESGLYYMGARYYDPKLARFISADTIVPLPFYPQSLNRYSFTMNNPVVLRELDGHNYGSYANSPLTHSSSISSLSSLSGPTGNTTGGSLGTGIHNASTSGNHSAHTVLFASSAADASVTPATDSGTATNGAMEGGGGTESSGLQQNNPMAVNNQNAAVQLQVQEPANVETQTCEGDARVLQGNSDLIGKEGAFPGVNVQDNSAAIIPEQFGATKSELKPYIDQISGDVGGENLFNGVTDVIGGKSPIPNMNVRTALQQLNPSTFIIEVVGSRDRGVVNIQLSVPGSLQCPTGTKRK